MDGDDAVAVDTVVAGRLAIDVSAVDLDVFCNVQAKRAAVDRNCTAGFDSGAIGCIIAAADCFEDGCAGRFVTVASFPE